MLRERAGPRPQPRPAPGLSSQGTSTSPGQPGKKHISRFHPPPPPPRTLIGGPGQGQGMCIYFNHLPPPPPIYPYPQVSLSQAEVPHNLNRSLPSSERKDGRAQNAYPSSLSRRRKHKPRRPWGRSMRGTYSRWQPPALPGGLLPSNSGEREVLPWTRRSPAQPPAAAGFRSTQAGKARRRPEAGTRRL